MHHDGASARAARSRLEAGEGIVVEITPGWYADGEQLSDEAGTHRLEFEVNDHNHNFWVGGPVSVRRPRPTSWKRRAGDPAGITREAFSS